GFHVVETIRIFWQLGIPGKLGRDVFLICAQNGCCVYTGLLNELCRASLLVKTDQNERRLQRDGCKRASGHALPALVVSSCDDGHAAGPQPHGSAHSFRVYAHECIPRDGFFTQLCPRSYQYNLRPGESHCPFDQSADCAVDWCIAALARLYPV